RRGDPAPAGERQDRSRVRPERGPSDSRIVRPRSHGRRRRGRSERRGRAWARTVGRAWSAHRCARPTALASRARRRAHPGRRTMAYRAWSDRRRENVDMTWRRERWTADHPLPIGVTKRAQVGELVRAGDIIAAGAALAGALRVPGARRLAGRIIVGGARVSAEVITRAHACGVAGLVAGGVPPAGLRVVYGDTVTASGSPSRDDRPTVLCLMGFGSAVLPRAVYEPFA